MLRKVSWPASFPSKSIKIRIVLSEVASYQAEYLTGPDEALKFEKV
jgi:hypothetical protein